MPKDVIARENNKRIPAKAQSSADELEGELNEAGVRLRAGVAHDAKNGIVARTATSVRRGELSAVEEIEKLQNDPDDGRAAW